MALVQVSKREGRIDRVRPSDAPPVVELDLEPNQRIVSIELRKVWSSGDRKTDDWAWTAYIENRV